MVVRNRRQNQWKHSIQHSFIIKYGSKDNLVPNISFPSNWNLSYSRSTSNFLYKLHKHAALLYEKQYSKCYQQIQKGFKISNFSINLKKQGCKRNSQFQDVKPPQSCSETNNHSNSCWDLQMNIQYQATWFSQDHHL